MKKLFLLLAAISGFGAASAQRVHFVYFQTEDQSPFYVRMADKIFSSAASGYLILPNLSDSTYTIHLGFAKSTDPETRFALPVSENDKGYLVKKFTDGLGLFDMQNLNVIKAATFNQSVKYETRSDHFSSVLSKAADDPSLLKVVVAKKEDKPNEVIAVVEEPKQVTTSMIDSSKEVIVSNPTSTNTSTTRIQDTAVITTPPATTENTTTTPAAQVEPTATLVIEQVYKRSNVRRYSESSTTEGLGVIYFDQTEVAIDTIRILIPPSKSKLEEIPVQTPETVSKPEQSTTDTIIANTTVSVKSEPVAMPQATSVANPACPNMASEKDFVKLRKNMVGKETDEDMIAEARKSFKTKCYTTEQLRYLGTLFMTSAARYQFFDAAYNHVSDKSAFGSLQSEIKDEYYLKRFKALIGE